MEFNSLSKIFFLVLQITNIASENFHLELVQVLFRHGDRTPDLKEIPINNPYSSTFDKLGYGRLTKVGMQRQYKLGQLLRRRYNNLIGPDEVDAVYPYSTPGYRTKVSLHLVLAGLFPVTNETSWNDEIPWLPIPINYDPPESNFLWSIYSGKCGKKYWGLVNSIGKSFKGGKALSSYETLIVRAQAKTGLSFVQDIFNYLQAIKNLGLKLPEWCSDQDFQGLRNVTIIMNESLTSTLWAKKMTAGSFLERFLQNIHDKSDPKRKMYLYSANDLQIIAISQLLNFTNVPKLPAYGSALIFEKYRRQDIEMLRILTWAGDSEEMIPVKLNECEHECPLQTFQENVEPYYPGKEDKEC
ncbi:hypothetical protein QAD02_023972 [Eretmocerus hayati]|uniref:Uncharacterized protein n=1 Tax=Eretmocerus hayati TaxID=131215 RepID=A0ACC2PXI1_9HYME|nr:hypothetical protein QAD02_023972 [Eretmocerus hayati]